MFWIGLAIGVTLSALLTHFNIRAAYNNGVTDGYGFSQEPTCPGYAKAGRYLLRYMRHRWPQLNYHQLSFRKEEGDSEC